MVLPDLWQLEKLQSPLHANAPHRPLELQVESGSGLEERRRSFVREANRSVKPGNLHYACCLQRPTKHPRAWMLANRSRKLGSATGYHLAAREVTAESRHAYWYS